MLDRSRPGYEVTVPLRPEDSSNSPLTAQFQLIFVYKDWLNAIYCFLFEFCPILFWNYSINFIIFHKNYHYYLHFFISFFSNKSLCMHLRILCKYFWFESVLFIRINIILEKQNKIFVEWVSRLSTHSIPCTTNKLYQWYF